MNILNRISGQDKQIITHQTKSPVHNDVNDILFLSVYPVISTFMKRKERIRMFLIGYMHFDLLSELRPIKQYDKDKKLEVGLLVNSISIFIDYEDFVSWTQLVLGWLRCFKLLFRKPDNLLRNLTIQRTTR